MKHIETRVADVSVGENDLLILRIKGGIVFTIDDMKAHYRAVYEVLGERMVIVLVDARRMRYADISGDVLRYMADNEYVKYQVASALLMNNVSMRMIGNVYLDLFRPRVPTRIFTTEPKAISWLLDRMETYQATSAGREAL
jgi:hypothetical protein